MKAGGLPVERDELIFHNHMFINNILILLNRMVAPARTLSTDVPAFVFAWRVAKKQQQSPQSVAKTSLAVLCFGATGRMASASNRE
jgi:hypothetical protein